MGWIMDFIRARRLEKKIRQFQKTQLESALNQQGGWTTSRFTCAKLWERCKCVHGVFASYIFKSFLGFLGGVFLSVLLLLMLVMQLHVSPVVAAVVCSLLGPPLALGLAFSSRVRCATLLVLPQLSSKRGRQAIVAFAFLLTITGPVANTANNMEQTAQSLTCTLHMASKGLGLVAEIVKRPAESAKKAVEKALNSIKKSVEEIKETLQKYQRVIDEIGAVVKSSEEWLQHIVHECNSEFGTPIERCYHLFEKTSKDCSDTLGPMFSWLCSVVYATSLVCNSLSAVSLVCVVANPALRAISSSIASMREKFMDEMDALFYVRVDYEQEFDADLATDNRTFTCMLNEMKADLRGTTRPFVVFYHLVGGLLGLTSILIFYKAHRYYQKYNTNDRFDNFYITAEVRDVDLARVRLAKEPILPLRPLEKRLYCAPTAFRLLRSERKRLVRSLIFLFLSTINIAYLLWCDYSLYWILDLIRRDIIFPKTLPIQPYVKLEVEGEGLIPDMFRNLSATLTSSQQEQEDYYDDFDPSSCVPNPIQPNFALYARIGSLLVLAWMCAFAEPFVLRLRPTILNLYFPERARARAVWLSAHILRERGALFRPFGAATNAQPLGRKDFLEKLKDRSWLARLIFGSKVRTCCVVCASAEEQFFECQALGCNAVYCKLCFDTQANMCSICEENLIQPEIPGLQLERESSDEEEEVVEEDANENSSSTDAELENVPLMDVENQATNDTDQKEQDLNDVPARATYSCDDDFIARFVRELERSFEEATQVLGVEMPKWN